jgi:hypothetical protein
MISDEFKPDKSDSNRYEFPDDRLNLVDFEHWEVVPPKSTKNF